MNRIILLLVILVGLSTLSARANYTVTTSSYQPLYSNSMAGYPTMQSYAQQYNQGYCQNPYQAQVPGQYVNSYQYQRPYNPYNSYNAYNNGYENNLQYGVVNPVVSGLNTTNVTTPIVRNIGQSMLYSMMRGY